MTVFESTDEAVFVTTFCTPPTSFCRRDWSSPVRVRVKKPQRHRLQVLVEAVAQVLHHLLADVRREVRLQHPEHGGDERNDDHQADEHVEQAEVRAAVRREERLVEHDLVSRG